MKILLATALFPPDVTPPAPYIKELVVRLAKHHSVSVLTYSAIPEAVEGTTVIVVPKHDLTLHRLLTFTYQLWRQAQCHDVMLVHNAPATELPAFLVGLFNKKKLQLVMSDKKITYTGPRKLIHRLATSTAKNTISIELPLAKPEIHPFHPLPPDAMSNYEASWKKHLSALKKYLA